MTIHRSSHVLMGLLIAATVAAGCGADSDRPSTSSAEPSADKAGVEQLLMRDGEEPGFRRVGTVFKDGINSFPPVDQAELREDGFVSITVQPIEDPDHGGLTNVQVFKTPAGARSALDRAQQTDVIHRALPGAKIRRFTVPGLPGAVGWTAPTPDGLPVGNVHWVQGRCLLVLGNQGPGPFAGQLGTGAKAIHARTKGQCP